MFNNRFTRQFGFPKRAPATKLEERLQGELREFIVQSPFLVMATSAADGSCDASPKGGRPGWVKILNDRQLLIPDVAGNRLFQSYLNMAENPQIGLIFFQPGDDETVRVNGTVEMIDRDALDELQVDLQVFEPDENAKILQGIVVTVAEGIHPLPAITGVLKVLGWRRQPTGARRPQNSSKQAAAEVRFSVEKSLGKDQP